MDWHVILGSVGGLLLIASGVPYVRGMLYGTTRPSIISQSLWLLINSILAVAQFAADAPWGALLALSAALVNFVIVILAFRGYGYMRYGWADGACFLFAFFAIAAWQVSNDPRSAIFFALVAYVFAVAPTVIKTYREPASEHVGSWTMVIAAGLCSILAAQAYDFANFAFPIYAIAEASVVAGLAFFGQRLALRTAIAE